MSNFANENPVSSTLLEPLEGGKETPLMQQYNAVKSKYPEAILLFRIGDFYETFGQDAVIVSQVLGITLTNRNNGSSQTELAGFPHHSLETYLPKLVRAGYRVAICDQLEKPSPLKKVVKRGVTEVVSPGTAIGDNMLESRSNNYLAAIHFGVKGILGISFLDVSTGEFMVAEGDAVQIDKLLQSFSPSEIILSKGRKKDFEKVFGDKYYTFPIDEWIFTEDYTRGKLLEQFEVMTLKGFGIEELSLAQIAAGATLHHIAVSEILNPPHINNLTRIHSEKYVWLDRFTVRNLELLHSQHENGVSLFNILDKTISPMGARLLKKWIALPLKDRKAIEARHDIVRYFIDKSEQSEGVTGFLKQIGDLERLISKISLQKVTPREMKHLQRSLSAIEPIQEILKASDSPALHSIAERMNPCPSLRDRIAKELKDELPAKVEKGGFISDGVNPDLDELRHLLNNSNSVLNDILQREATLTGITNLKIGFNSVFGYYLEVTNKHKDNDKIPATWIRKQTLTNAERYITEELKVLETKILSAEEKIQDIEIQVFKELVAAAIDYIKPIQLNASLLAQLDCLISFSEIAIRFQYCRPQMNDSNVIDITEARHPVIERQLPVGEQYVPNDIKLDNDDCQMMMITGPNMSGKSAVLRQTALISLMAQMGSFVPARIAKLGIIDKVFTRVGASDNLSQGESTFMVEMTETAGILNNITEKSLILLDEIGRGTGTYDGISIAWAIAEFLHNSEQRPKTLFATHYHELNELEERHPRVKNYHITSKEIGNKIIFLRKLAEGGVEQSFGIHVARMAGLPRPVVQRAAEILAELEKKHIEENKTADNKQKLRQVAAPMQLSFFDAAPPADPILEELRDELKDLDLNRLTPIECMLKLVELKKKIEG